MPKLNHEQKMRWLGDSTDVTDFANPQQIRDYCEEMREDHTDDQVDEIVEGLIEEWRDRWADEIFPQLTQILATTDLEIPHCRRLRVRRVDEIRIACKTMFEATLSSKPVIDISHGGSVANSYGYPAETEAVVTVAIPGLGVVQDGTRVSANKPTGSGILAAACGEWARPIADGRYRPELRERAESALIELATLTLQEKKEAI